MKALLPDERRSIATRLRAHQELGFKCRVRIGGLARLLDLAAEGQPVAGELLKTCMEVIEHTGLEKKRFHAIMEADQLLRGILELIFVDAPWTVSGHLRSEPDWLEEMTGIEGNKHPDHPGKG